MKRRGLLRSVGVAATLGAIAGCTSADGPGGSSTKTPREDQGTTTPGADEGPVVATQRIGSRGAVAFPDATRPHGLFVRNMATTTREVRLHLTDETETVRLSETYTLPADGRVEMRLLEPSSYTLSVGLDGESLGTVTIPDRLFDCNESRTTVDVGPDGSLDSTTASTLVACPEEPSVVATSTKVTGSDCASGDEAAANVSADQGAVTITGTLLAPTPCHEVRVVGTSYEDDADRLVVRLGASEPEDSSVCVACVGAIGYEATLELARTYPGSVEVVHEGAEGHRVITRGSLGVA